MSAGTASPSREHVESYTFVAFPKFMILWPWILFGIILYFLYEWGAIDRRWMSIAYLWLIICNVFALGYDFRIKTAVIIFLFVISSVTTIILLASLNIFTLFVNIFLLLDVGFEADTVLGFSVILGAMWLITPIFCCLFNRWVVRPGYIERVIFFRWTAEEHSIAPGNNSRIIMDISDVMDSILTLGGGYLHIMQDEKIIRIIGMVTMVAARDEYIDRHFEKTPITS